MNKIIKTIFKFVVFVAAGLPLQAMDGEHDHFVLQNVVQELKILLSSTADSSSSISPHKKFLPPHDYKSKLGLDGVVAPSLDWLASLPQSALQTPERKKSVCSIGTQPAEKGSANAKKMGRLREKNECLARLADRCDNFIAIIVCMRRQIKNSIKTDPAGGFQAFDYSSDDESVELSTLPDEYTSNDYDDDCEELLLNIALIRRDVVTIRKESLTEEGFLPTNRSLISLFGSNENEIDSKNSVGKESNNIDYAIELLDQAMQSIEEARKFKACSSVDNAKKIGSLAVALSCFNKVSKIRNLSSSFTPISSSSIGKKIFDKNTYPYLPI